MRIDKKKLHCDCCGKFLRELTNKEMKLAESERMKGARLNCSAICFDCDGKGKRI